MAFKVGNLTITKFIKGILGTRLIDPIEVYYLNNENVFYPIISKSGCSTVKLTLIQKYNNSFYSKFPEIHNIDPKIFTDGKVERLYFKNFKKYLDFCSGKKICMVIRNPYDRIYSCFLDVKKEKNIMYYDPNKLHKIFRINNNVTFKKFLSKVILIPDYLSDRHFRSQTFYFNEKVVNKVNDEEIVLIENFNITDKSTNILNANDKGIPSEVLDYLKSNKKFSNRFKEDIKLYNERLSNY